LYAANAPPAAKKMPIAASTIPSFCSLPNIELSLSFLAFGLA
jgi:hypothetical protein